MEGKPMDMMPVAEMGECVHTIFKQPSKYDQKFIGLSSCRHTVEECAQILEKALDGKATFKALQVSKIRKRV